MSGLEPFNFVETRTACVAAPDIQEDKIGQAAASFAIRVEAFGGGKDEAVGEIVACGQHGRQPHTVL